MNILVIGGCQVYGYGLTGKQRSFLDQFVARLEELGHRPQLTSYVFLPLPEVRETLKRLNLSQFDLLLIQPAHYYLQHPSSFWKLFKTPAPKLSAQSGIERQAADLSALRAQPTLPLDTSPVSWAKQTKNELKRLLLTLSRPVGLVNQLRYVEQELAALLEQLTPHRQKIILLTPTPHREPVSQWLRKQGRTIVMNEGNRCGMTVLDTHLLIRPREEFYIADDPSHLNTIGHELLGRVLFRCYKAKQAILADSRVQAIMEGVS